MLEFRLLRADEIEARIASVGSWGVQLLLYKDARVDQCLLDETVGPMNWQRHHSRDNANCVVSIWDAEKSQWIEKEDTGTESNTEREKGLASDSFKRACFCWGIGRELYTAPAMFVRAGDLKTLEEKSGKWTCRDHFTVTGIEYDDRRRIISVEIVNDMTGQRSSFSNGKPAARTGRIGSPEIARLKLACEAAGDQMSLEKALAACKRSDASEITFPQYEALMKQLGAVA